ncbi:MAG: hypothetical protein WDN04_22350 [Rhodospirillales bacterium]
MFDDVGNFLGGGMDHLAAASFLLAARGAGAGGLLPAGLRPVTAADAYEIQRLTVASLGPVGGWKVGAAGRRRRPTARRCRRRVCTSRRPCCRGRLYDARHRERNRLRARART